MIRWLTCWRWRFGREWSIQSDGTLQVTLLAKGPLVMLPAREREEGSCVVWDPMRREFRTSHIQVFRGHGFCSYPGSFPGAPNVAAGTYWISRQERKLIWRNGKPAGPGKWHFMDFYRIKVKESDLAANPPAPPPTTPSS
jgi:hypothetical protein